MKQIRCEIEGSVKKVSWWKRTFPDCKKSDYVFSIGIALLVGSAFYMLPFPIVFFLVLSWRNKESYALETKKHTHFEYFDGDGNHIGELPSAGLLLCREFAVPDNGDMDFAQERGEVWVLNGQIIPADDTHEVYADGRFYSRSVYREYVKSKARRKGIESLDGFELKYYTDIVNENERRIARREEREEERLALQERRVSVAEYNARHKKSELVKGFERGLGYAAARKLIH